MTGEKWTIYWNEYSSDTYLYGSQITYHSKDDVEFTNELMPPGTIIKKWYSKTNYHINRIEPSLPMIDGENEYQIAVNIDCEDRAKCLIRLVFYDRFEVEVGSITIRDKITDFKCPIKTYSYSMQLINGGVKSFHFHSVIMREIINETESNNKNVKKNSGKNKKL